MTRLQADADAARWVAVTGSLGLRGRRHRKAAIRAVLQSGGAGAGRGTGAMAWALSQATPFLMRRAGGRLLVWVWKDEPELVVVTAQLQDMTPQLRASRAMMPMEYDDTEDFRSPHLGVGEKLVLDDPSDASRPPTAMYTWDTGAHLVSVTAVGIDPLRLRTLIGPIEDLARTVRIVDDLRVAEASGVLRLDPA
ncbi:hypothetical protein [Microbacterium marinilacus]|uniref:Uncharacterized protein n=1 Tax=Microbacterium marinilacus TaxID=415209 RepID=A0ABP7BT68_9MICO|nr:hypothetical protein [Microbacterium marinilacus]MBY0689278.1 hypothetical protein [Microbacterium marinilacus]